MKKTYKSAVDLWLALLLIGVPLALILTGLSIALGLRLLHWHEGLGTWAGLILIGSGLAVAALIAAFALPCRYTLGETALHIQAGILGRTIPYHAIRHLELSTSLWAAPALSLNRVKIHLDDGFVLLSPADRIAFIQDLQTRIPAGSVPPCGPTP